MNFEVEAIRGSTLIEVIVAMLISSIIFFLSTSVILNLAKTDQLKNQYYCHLLAENILLEKKCLRPLDNKISHVGVLEIEEKSCVYLLNEDLLLLSIEVKDLNGYVLAKSKCIIRNSQ